MSKVLILANHYNTLRIFRRELIKELAARGHEIVVSIPACDEENRSLIESYGCKVLFIKMERREMNPIHDLGVIKDYLVLLKNVRPDKVITYTIKPNIYGAIVCKWLNIPCYVNITGLGSAFQSQSGTRKLVSLMYKASMNKAQAIFFENAGNRDTLVRDGIVKQEKTVVMAGAGVNLDEFPACPYPESESPLHFLFVGRIMQEKGVDELFSTIPRIREKYADTVFEFIGWYEDNYKEKIEKLVSDGLIQFNGFQSDVKPFIEKAHCVVLPSHHEGMSNTLLESAAMCRPLITNDIPGCREAVIDGVTGYLTVLKDAESLYTQMVRFAVLPYEEKREMGLRGRKHMEQCFDKRDVVKKTITILGL